MTKRDFLIVLALLPFFIFNTTYAQITLQGVVADSDSDPIAGALVQLIDQSDTTKIYENVTDENGAYLLQIITALDEHKNNQPGSFILHQNYPNPFNPSTIIRYELTQPAHVTIEIHNILGQKIRTLVNEFSTNLAGTVTWDATDEKGQGVSAGIYIYTLTANGQKTSKKMLLVDGHQGTSGYGGSITNNYADQNNPVMSKPLAYNFLFRVSAENIQTIEEELQLVGDLTYDVTVVRTINKEAVFIDSTTTQITVTSVDTTSYDIPVLNLQLDGEVPDLEEGSVIVDKSGTGKIYVVIDDNKLKKGMGEVTVFQGSLDFLLQNSAVQIATPQNRTKQSTEVIENKLPLVSDEVYGNINGLELYLPIEEDSLIAVIPFSNETLWEDPDGKFSLTIPEGSLTFRPAVDLDMVYSERLLEASFINPVLSIGLLQYLRVITYSDMDLDLKINFHAEGDYDIFDEKVELISYMHAIPVGPVLLTLKVTLNLNFNMDVDAAMDITTGYQVKNNVVIGYELPNGTLSVPVFFTELEKIEEKVLQPELEADISLTERLEIVPDIEVYVYGIIGLNGEVIPYQDFALNAHLLNDLVDWDCEVGVGLDGKISFDLSAFHFDEATLEVYNKYFEGPDTVLYSAPHLEIVSGTPQDGAVGERLSDPFRVRAVDSRGNLCALPVNVYWDVMQGGGQLDDENSSYTYADGFAENYYSPGSAGENRISSYLKKADGTIHDENLFDVTVEDDGYQTGTMTDIDGNVYKTVKIGDQWWMAENLKVTRYRNGDAIPNVTDNTQWANLSTGAYCAYNNDNGNVATYGLLYNWYAVDDSRNIAPEGWHVATDEEWKELEMYLGMSQSEADGTGWRGTNEGSKLKAESGWYNNGNSTNSSGFTALPGGYRYSDTGTFYGIGYRGYWWSATELSSTYAWHRDLGYKHSAVNRGDYRKRNGFSVRLIRD